MIRPSRAWSELRGIRNNLALLLTSLLFAMIMLPLVAYYFVSYWTTEKTILNTASQHCLDTLQNQTDYLDLQLDQIEALAANLGQVDEITAALAKLNTVPADSTYDALATKARIGYLLSNYRNLNGLVSIDLYALNGNHFHVGDSLAETDERTDLRQELWDRTLRSTEAVTWHGVQDNVHKFSSSAKVIAATRLFLNPGSSWLKAEPVGMLLISYSTDYLYEHFRTVDIGRNAYLLVLDDQKRFIYHPDKAEIGHTVTPAFGQLLQGPSGSFLQRIGATDFLLSYHYLPEKRWYVVSVVPKETLLATMGSIRRVGGVMLVVSALLIALYVRLFAVRVVAPIGAIADGFRQVQLNQVTPGWRMKKPQSLKPIVDLVMWFNTFLESLESRREAEVKLRIAATAFESQEGMVITDENDVVLQVNTAFTSITGYSAAEAVGRTSRSFNGRPEDTGFYDTVNRFLRDQGSWRGEIRNVRKNGEAYPAWLNVTAVRSESGRTTHFVSTLTDITELAEAQSRLREMNQALNERTLQAEEASSAKSQFLANMSHEIRTPMNAVLGYTQLLQRESDLSELHRGYVTTIGRSGQHLLELINDVLEMSKIEAGQTKLSDSDFDFHGLLNDLMTMFRIRMEEKGLALTMEIGPGVPRHLCTDAMKVKQVLINVIGNALKFTETGGVAITATALQPGPDGVEVRVAVRDTGIGFDEASMPKIFNAFEQADGGLDKGGTGLGMAISRRYANMLGGDLTATSAVGQGSCFTFSFRPQLGAETAQAPELQLREARRLASGSRTLQVLIVDDVAVNRILLRHLLKPFGFKFSDAVNGQECLHKLETLSPDLILMDSLMPVMDGLEASRRIRRSDAWKHIPIFLITASAFEENRVKAEQAGIDAFISKPIMLDVLCRAIEQHVEGVRFDYEPGQRA